MYSNKYKERIFTLEKLTRTFLVLIILTLCFSGSILAEENLTINYKTTTEDDPCYIPIEYELDLFDENFNEIDQSFPVQNDSRYVRGPAKISSIRSSEVITIGNDSPAIIKDLPENTNYRLTLTQNPSAEMRIDQTVITGKVSENPEITINGEYNPEDPKVPLPFKISLAEGVEETNLAFTYTLTCDSDSQLNTEVTFTGAGLYNIPVELSKPGTYTFTLKPTTVSGGSGFVVTPSECTFIVEYQMDMGGEGLVINITPDETPPEFIVQKTEVTYTPEITKEVSGNETNKESFTFTLDKAADQTDENFSLPQNTTITLTNGERKSFDPITFYAQGTYQFSIKEINDESPGYSYDLESHDLTVEIEQDSSGALKIKSANYSSEGKAIFKNTYNSGNLIFKKVVTGKEEETQKFKFKISLTDTKDTPLSGTYPAEGIDAQTIKHGDTFELSANGTLKITGLPEGAQYSFEELDLSHGYTSEFSPPSGSIVKGQDNQVICTNTYQPDPISYAPIVSKSLTGSPKTQENFEFEIKNKDAEQGVILPEKLTLQTGQKTFNEMTFTKAGTYYFVISEVKGEVPGYTYDEKDVNLTIEVIDNEGKLSIKQALYEKEGETDTTQAIFKNSYTPTQAEYSPKVIKSVLGNPPDAYYNFKFILSKEDGVPDGDDLTGEKEITLSSGESENTFEPIHFTKEGEYHYLIKEEEGEGSFDYDSSQIKLTVTVEDIGGTLTTQATYVNGEDSNDEAAKFTNTYKSGSLKITKNVSGIESDDSFTFRIRLTEGEASSIATFTTDKEEPATIKDNDSFSLKNGESITISGLPLGIHYELIEEGLKGGYQSSFNPNASGEITEQNEVDITCLNNYIPTPTSYEPKIRKELTGLEPPSNETFSFNITPHEDNPEGGTKEVLTGTVSGKGEVTINPIEFSKAGIFKYTVTETKGESPGYTYDESSYELEIEVIDTEGILSVNRTTITKEDEPIEEIVFTNSYNPDPVEVIPKVEKQIEGSPPINSEFTFTLSSVSEGDDSFTLPESLEAKISGQGETEFSPISFKKAGTYTFEIAETAGSELGYDYDKTIWILTVEIEDTGGSLSASLSYSQKEAGISEALTSLSELIIPKVEAAEREATFSNTFHSGTLKIKKTVNGESDSSFPFHLELKDSEYFALPGNFETSTGEVIGSVSDFELKGGEEIEIRGIPVGARFAAEELEVDGFYCESPKQIGEIKEGENEIEFINTPTSSVTIRKEVDGEDKGPFNFKITFTNPRGDPIDDSFLIGEKPIKSGDTFSLGKDEEVTLSNLPVGTEIKVEELDTPGYTIISDNSEIRVESEPTKVTLTNKPVSVSVPKTGDTLIGLLVLLVVVLISLIAIHIYKRRSK